ncbi:MAG TPA: chromosome segregation protein SMC [Rhizomicrobium sp.]|nr:chromosome segregation protein SMC [Rhizomicrobium sp.]
MKFTRLRLSGFKSFVEPTELFIEPGLTAIIGPNGCGKSNLFDALRWVMGEARPTSVRGSEMDDVIFAGSAARPARNLAEVILFVDNTDRSAPAPYNEYDTIEVSRRIEREAGSVYRINGRDQRQRDVQIFFADASSGAASTAFVRQGQIGLLISQKPLARRAILEEAAGIGGLHQRRHEAELRLRAAETNMSRLDDLIRELEGQLQNLKRQARQAARYRNISGLIRKAEALAHYIRWIAAESHLRAAQTALQRAHADVAACTGRAAEAATARANSASELDPLRLTEAERNAALHRLTIERDTLDQEETRAREAAQRQRQHIVRAEQDLAREKELDRDAGSSLAALAGETRTLEHASANAAREIADAESGAIAHGDALVSTERALESLTNKLAEWNARKQSQTRAREIAAALTETSAQQLVEAESRLEAALAGAAQDPDVNACEADVARTRHAALEAHESLERLRGALDLAEAAEAEARAPLEIAEREEQHLSAEAGALADLLRPQGADLWPPLIDAVRVESGYEAALAAALGDELDSPIDEAAPNHWRDLGPLESLPLLPGEVIPLSNYVAGPPALARRLAMTAVVPMEIGAALQRELRPGQRLVSIRGDLWRWDGYAMSADAPSPAAQRLAQRNRLSALDAEIAGAREKTSAALARFSAARNEANFAREAARSAEQHERQLERDLGDAQEAAARAARNAAERSSRLATFEAEIRRLSAARDAARDATGNADAALAELGDGAAISLSVAQARENAAEARAADLESRAFLEKLRQESGIRAQRIVALADECARWQNRRDAALRQIEELNRRLDEMRIELQLLEAAPETLAGRRRALLEAIAQAETARDQAADARAMAESMLAAADKAAKIADAALATAREERARADAMALSAQERLSELQGRVRDELDVEPSLLASHAGIAEGDELPALDHAEKRVEKLKAEREQLGGVNLRAEEEAAEAGQRLDGLTRDRADLDGAIQRLRRGIQSLNREGRERLLESFEKVDANFQLLFAKLFDGGEAKLSLTESDDPLEAGLEIFARPPGKRLQSLSLLSGGEQALTALALIFAVFLVNPAPVCVLDEVDAPLDDANVERFCNLLDEMTKLAATRFIVITHHALTMSRMNRLFGVTMGERGVSQLVSVTLAEAERVAAAE